MNKPKNIDDYIQRHPKEIQTILKHYRVIIKKAAPMAEEVISYGMPAFKLNGMLVYFAAHSWHTGFYPGSSCIDSFKKEISFYKWSKGSVQFPFDKPLPAGLITKIVKFRMKENLLKAKSKDKMKK